MNRQDMIEEIARIVYNEDSQPEDILVRRILSIIDEVLDFAVSSRNANDGLFDEFLDDSANDNNEIQYNCYMLDDLDDE